MDNEVYITDHSPVLFFQKLAEKVGQGFYADDSIEGFPRFDLFNEVRLKKGDKPKQRQDLADFHTVNIHSWHNATFILEVQDALLQGFEIDDTSVHIGSPHMPHSVTVVRKSAKKAPEPVQAPVSAPEPEAVPTPEVEAVIAPEAPVEAPEVSKRKGGRPPKSKEL